jgi:hypothetical protein
VEDKRPWTTTGAFWSLAAGTAGAVGALGIILALSNGGHPSWVMPLVFGGAPVVNTMLTITVARQWNQVSPAYIAGLLLVGVGAVTVLVFKPAVHKPSKPTESAAPVTAQADPRRDRANPFAPSSSESAPSSSEH